MVFSITRRVLMGGAFAAAALVTLPFGTASAADFSGKTIEWLVPFGVGGGTDTWARFNAPFLQKYLPGNPTVVIKNVPGGGSTTGANQFAARARPDGLTLLGTSGSTQFPYLLKDPRVRYDYTDMKIFLASPTGGVAYVSPDLGIKDASQLGELKGKQLTYASQGATSLDLVPLLAFRLLGLDVKHVFGFKGRGDGRVAFERGEANIDYQTSSAYLTNVQPLVDQGSAVPMFSWGTLDEDGNLVRDPTFPDLPHFGEVYKEVTGNELSGKEWEAYQAFFVSGFPAQKMGLLPGDTPDDIVQAFSDAVTKMKDDPEYQEKKEAVLGTYEQVTGKAAQALKKAGTEVPDEARQYVVDLLTSEYNVDLSQ